nr:MAG TPA: hypothetical protein [Caudoviricetes sp.]
MRYLFFIARKGDDRVANLKGKMKKLQTAIIKCGMVVKINQNQFYSVDQNRMITSYRIITPVCCYNKFSKEWKTRDYEILKTCSMVDVIYCLLDIYKAVSG